VTRTALTLELLAILALACDRQEKAVEQPTDGGKPTEAVEPELSNTVLEQELDRLEQEIKNGKRPVDAGARGGETAKEPSTAGAREAPTSPKPHRNKSKTPANKAPEKNVHGPSRGSS
jgi:hypothetical protein